MMRHSIVVLGFGFVVGCCPCRHIGASVDTQQADTAYVAHHDVVRIIVRDTVRMQPLAPSHDKVVTKALHSELSNAYCVSIADIDGEGYLTHTLDTRDSAMLPVREMTRDSIIRDTLIRYRTRVETRVKEVRVKVVPWWVKPLGIIAAALAVIVLWQNRRRIITLIRLWRI